MQRWQRRFWCPSILCATATVVLFIPSNPAAAGGFALREESAVSQGASFAGSAANGGISAMFWNSAAATSQNGLNSASSYSLIIPHAELTAVPGTTAALLNPAIPQQAEIAHLAFTGAGYYNWQVKDLNPNLYFGLAMNSPFGLATKPDPVNWAGVQLGRTTKLFTFNVNPVVAYKVAPGLSIGVGPQFEYADAKLTFAVASPNNPAAGFSGDSFAAGATVGIMWQPTNQTTVGLGWRSQITHTLSGSFSNSQAIPPTPPAFPGAPPLSLASEATLRLPDVVTLSLRQVVTPNVRLLGTIEWSNWSRFDDVTVVASSTGATVLGPRIAGSTIASLPAKWEDGWFFSGGLEYDIIPALTLRTGVAWERSPIRDATQRLVGIPDADRTWLSIGASYQWRENVVLDLAYSHIFVADAQVDRTGIGGAPSLVADLDAHIDIISVGTRIKW
jgi:long-chain fatty acid transport protein